MCLVYVFPRYSVKSDANAKGYEHAEAELPVLNIAPEDRIRYSRTTCDIVSRTTRSEATLAITESTDGGDVGVQPVEQNPSQHLSSGIH